MKRGYMINRLIKKFPGISGIRASEELGYAKGAIHLGDCAEGGEIDGIPACDYYNEDYNESIYVMGVHRKLKEELENNGWYAECYNPGMYHAFEI